MNSALRPQARVGFQQGRQVLARLQRSEGQDEVRRKAGLAPPDLDLVGWQRAIDRVDAMVDHLHPFLRHTQDRDQLSLGELGDGDQRGGVSRGMSHRLLQVTSLGSGEGLGHAEKGQVVHRDDRRKATGGRHGVGRRVQDLRAGVVQAPWQRCLFPEDAAPWPAQPGRRGR